MSEQPTHYVVIKSPFAQQILAGTKRAEYRPEGSAKAIGNKTLAIAVSKVPVTPESGMIIGQATFGKPVTRSTCMSIPVKDYELWPREKWIKSPGGLGVRPLPLADEPSTTEQSTGFFVEVTQEQKEIFEELAEAEGLSVGDYLLKTVKTVEIILKEWGMSSVEPPPEDQR